MKYVKPELNKSGFHCPICGVYAQQLWGRILEDTEGRGWKDLNNWKGAFCDHCTNISLWLNNELIYPNKPNIPLPNEDLDEDIKKDYNEACDVIEKSPKAAAALLRLAVQKLCKQLGESGSNINKDIGELVKKGLPVEVQKALDIVRVIGNESVHPGQINLDDNRDTAYKLFELVNMIAQIMITQPKEISKLYEDLPQDKLNGIENRDS